MSPGMSLSERLQVLGEKQDKSLTMTLLAIQLTAAKLVSEMIPYEIFQIILQALQDGS